MESRVTFWKEMSKLFDKKTNWIDNRIKELTNLPLDPYIPVVINILSILKKKFMHFPPPNNTKDENLENYCPAPPGTEHAAALQKIAKLELPYHCVIRWALTWYSHVAVYFRFEMIVVSDKLITETFAVDNMKDLEVHLSKFERQMIQDVDVDSYIRRNLYWSFKEIEEKAIILGVRRKELIRTFHTEVTQVAKKQVQSLLDQIASKDLMDFLDSVQLPHHNLPLPLNPYPANPNFLRKDIHWKVILKTSKQSKVPISAFMKCLRRCINFVLQPQLTKFWSPPWHEKILNMKMEIYHLYNERSIYKKNHLDWVPFEATSVHNSRADLWPAFLLSEAKWLVSPIASIVTSAVLLHFGLTPVEELHKRSNMLNYESIFLDSEQISALFHSLKK